MEFSLVFGIMSIIPIIMFVVVFCVVIAVFVKVLKQKQTNARSPRLTVNAEVVGKRTEISHRHHGSEDHMRHTSTYYYVTFLVESGDRMELHVPGYEYGLMIEGDFGDLTFQVTRFLSFARKAPAMDEA